MKKIIIDYQTIEEKEEMYMILIDSNIPKENIIDIPEYEKIQKKSYIFKFIGWKINRLILLFKFFMRFNGILFTGSPALQHRLFIFIYMKKIKHIIYYRGLLLNPNSISSISDYIRIKILKNKFNNKLVNNYLCDYIITIGEINKLFLIKRGVPEDRILLCGLIPYNKKLFKVLKKINKVILLTSAFDSHHHEKSAREQISFARSLNSLCKKYNYLFIIKKHPRDYSDYKTIFKGENVKIFTKSAKEFMYTLKGNEFIVSPISTFAFELDSLNIPVSIYMTESMKALFKDFNKIIEDNSLITLEKIEKAMKTNQLKILGSNLAKIYSNKTTDFNQIFKG